MDDLSDNSVIPDFETAYGALQRLFSMAQSAGVGAGPSIALDEQWRRKPI